jgi:hypothetical protein
MRGHLVPLQAFSHVTYTGLPARQAYLHSRLNWPSGHCGIAATPARRIPASPADCSDRSRAVRRDQTGGACAFA